MLKPSSFVLLFASACFVLPCKCRVPTGEAINPVRDLNGKLSKVLNFHDLSLRINSIKEKLSELKQSGQLGSKEEQMIADMALNLSPRIRDEAHFCSAQNLSDLRNLVQVVFSYKEESDQERGSVLNDYLRDYTSKAWQSCMKIFDNQFKRIEIEKLLDDNFEGIARQYQIYSSSDMSLIQEPAHHAEKHLQLEHLKLASEVCKPEHDVRRRLETWLKEASENRMRKLVVQAQLLTRSISGKSLLKNYLLDPCRAFLANQSVKEILIPVADVSSALLTACNGKVNPIHYNVLRCASAAAACKCFLERGAKSLLS